MILQKLLQEYQKLLPGIKKVYVVPLINLKLKDSDYMYLLYKEILESKTKYPFELESLSVFAHPKFFFKKILGEKNILHYNWLEVTDLKSLFGIFWKLFWITAYKFISGKVVWTVHNKFPHNNNYRTLNKIFRKYMARIADKLHVHCNYAVDCMSEVLNVSRSKFFIVEHPLYPAINIDRKVALKKLAVNYSLNIQEDKKIFLIFGAVAKYKGILEAARVFKENIKEHYLIIAGSVKKGNREYFEEIEKEILGSENIFLIGKMISNDDLPLFYNSSDYVIFNYEEILTSGGVMTAMSFNKKIIAPAIGCISEIKNENIIHFSKRTDSVNNLRDILLSVSR